MRRNFTCLQKSAASLANVTEVPVTERQPAAGRRTSSTGRSLGAFLRRHGALVALVVVAAALRALAVAAIYPGIWFSDTNSYVHAAATGTVSAIRTTGYSLFVAPFYHAHSAGALIVAQHLIGLAIIVVLYAWLVRRGVSRWVAVLAVVPAALDAYLVDIEHTIMAETVFHASVVGAIVVLLWNERVGLAAAVAGGLLLGYAGVVRSPAIPFIALFALYLLLRRAGWRPLVGLCVAWAVVVGGYMTVYHAQHGVFALTQFDGRFLYAKAARFADCGKLTLPPDERALCPDPAHRLTSNAYIWGASSPIHGLPVTDDARVRDFALSAIGHEPLTYARGVGRDVAHYFEPGRRIGANDYPDTVWQFPSDPRTWAYPGYRGPIRPGHAVRKHSIDPGAYITAMASQPRLDPAASQRLHDYQALAYTPGPLLAACLLVVVLALALARGRGRVLALDGALLAACTVTSLVMVSAFSIFDYRYGLLAVILLPAAAALGATALWQRRQPQQEPAWQR